MDRCIPVELVTIIDPRSGGEVDVEIFIEPRSGGMFGIDASYLEMIQDEDTLDAIVREPFNNREVICPVVPVNSRRKRHD